MSGGGEDNKSQLLAEIEEFSRNGPRVSAEPTKPELHRETLAFPDLNKPAAAAQPAKSANPVVAAVPPAPTLEAPSSLGAASLLARLKQQAQSLQQGADERDARLDAQV